MTAAELLEQVATRFWNVLELALPSLPQELRAALAWRVEDGDMRWALSLMLAGWRLTDPSEPKANDVSKIIKQLGASWVLGQINLLRNLDGFESFADRARDADSEPRRKAAAVALTGTIERLDRAQLALFVAMLRREEVRQIGKVLIRRFPMPGSTRLPVWATPPETPRPHTSRGELFDRADYAPRERALMRTRYARTGSTIADEESPPVPMPELDEHAMTVAFLHTLGHSEAEIARLMAGPPKKPA